MKGKGQWQRLSLLAMKERAKQEAADKTQKAKIETAEGSIRRIQRRYPEKSLLHLLRRIRLELGDFAEEVAISRIERNQGDRLSLEDRLFVEGEKQILLQNRSLTARKNSSTT